MFDKVRHVRLHPRTFSGQGACLNSSSDYLASIAIPLREAPAANDAIDASDFSRVVEADEVDAEVVSSSVEEVGTPLPRPRSLIPTDILDAIAGEEAAVLSHDAQIAHAAQVVEEILLDDDSDIDILSERVDRQTAFELLTQSEVLRAIPHDALFDLATGAHRHHYGDRGYAFEEGASADSFFVVESGTLEAVRGTKNTREVALSHLSEGTPFGLFGLLCQGARSATVRSIGESTVIEISGAQLEKVMRRSPEARSLLARFFKERLLENFLGGHPIFRNLDALGRAALISHFQDRKCQPGELLVSPGEVQSSITLITSGSVRGVLRSSGTETELCRLGRGEFFAVVSAISGCPGRASITAIEPTTICVLPQKEFHDFVQGYPALRDLPNTLRTSAQQVDRDLFVSSAAQFTG